MGVSSQVLTAKGGSVKQDPPPITDPERVTGLKSVTASSGPFSPIEKQKTEPTTAQPKNLVSQSPPSMDPVSLLQDELKEVQSTNEELDESPKQKKRTAYLPKSASHQKPSTFAMRRVSSLSAGGDAESLSDVSSDWGPGFENLSPVQQQILEDLRSSTARKELDAKRDEMRKKYQRCMRLMNTNMLSKWN